MLYEVITKSPVLAYAEEKIAEVLKKHLPKKSRPDIKVVNNNTVEVKVLEKFIPAIIGKGGKEISKLEEITGLRISVVITSYSIHYTKLYEFSVAVLQLFVTELLLQKWVIMQLNFLIKVLVIVSLVCRITK